MFEAPPDLDKLIGRTIVSVEWERDTCPEGVYRLLLDNDMIASFSSTGDDMTSTEFELTRRPKKVEVYPVTEEYGGCQRCPQRKDIFMVDLAPNIKLRLCKECKAELKSGLLARPRKRT